MQTAFAPQGLILIACRTNSNTRFLRRTCLVVMCTFSLSNDLFCKAVLPRGVQKVFQQTVVELLLLRM